MIKKKKIIFLCWSDLLFLLITLHWYFLAYIFAGEVLDVMFLTIYKIISLMLMDVSSQEQNP